MVYDVIFLHQGQMTSHWPRNDCVTPEHSNLTPMTSFALFKASLRHKHCLPWNFQENCYIIPGTTLLARCPGKCLVTSFLVTSSKWAQSLHSQKKVIFPGYSFFWFSVHSLLYIYRNVPSVNITCLDIKLFGFIGVNRWKMLIEK